MARGAPSGRTCRLLRRSPPVPIVCAAIALVLTIPVTARAQQAPDFTLKDLSGRTWSLHASFADKIVLLDFWATWCVPCIKELPHLQRLQNEYGEKGLQVLAISMDGPDRLAGVSEFVARYGFTLPVLLDTESAVVSIYNPSLVLPHSVLVDRSGRIRYVHQGYSPGDERLLEEKIAALLQESPPKPTPGTSVQINESFLLRLPNEGSPQTAGDRPYSEGLNQLNLTLANRGLLAGARLDTSLDTSPFEPDFRLGKRYVQYTTKRLEARAGDFYTSLGRGLVFSMMKIFEEEGLDYVVDTTVDGGRATLSMGSFSGDVFGGWIDRPDDVSLHDKVVGFDVGSTWASVGTVRFQGVSADLEPGAEFRNHRVQTGSVSVQSRELAGRAEVYGEFSLIRRRTYPSEAPIDGHGLYVGSKVHAGRFSLLLEVKDYKELNFELAHPPLLESEDIDIVADQFDLDRTDVTGFSARLDYFAPASQTLLYAKYLSVHDNPQDHRVFRSYDREIGHLLGGIERKFAGGGYVHGLAGWRHESATPNYFPLTEGATIHEQVNISWPVGGGWSVEGDWKHKKFYGDQYDYSEVRAELSLHRSPRWVLSALYERTTNPAILFFSGRKDYGAGQLEVRFAGHSVRVFAGATKGSMRCAGGVCRLFPPFEGVRAEAFLRF